MSVTKEQLNKLSEPLPIEFIDFRVQSITDKGYATILAYKDARVDMKRLDDVVGAENWQRDHKVIGDVVYCGIGIRINNEWVWKWDAGTESFSDKEKGQASDSFKRSGFNWGIGRELYNYPRIRLQLTPDEWNVVGGRAKQTYKLKLSEWKWIINFNGKDVAGLAAKDESGSVRFLYGTFPKKQ